MSWKKVKIKEVLKQYRVQHIVQDSVEYKQVSILNDGSVVLRGNKIGKEIGRKRQFKIDLRTYPDTLIFTRQLLLQGSIGIASEDVNDCIVTENMPMFSIQTSKIDKEFLILFLKSEVFKSRIRKIELSGSAQKSIHEKTFLDLEFLIPDINLQKIIVVELLKLKSNGDTISTELTHQLNLIKQLRQAFLREAMQGKLVKSNNTKETGQQLLTKIKAEKTQLIADKKLKKEKELAPITEDEIPFEIPEHWAWCRLGDVVNEILGGYAFDSTRYSKTETNNQVIRLGNVKPNQLVLDTNPVFIDNEYANEANKSNLKIGDILITMTGTRAKRDYLFSLCLSEYDFNTKNLFLNQRVGCFRFPKLISNNFINILLKDNKLIEPIFESSTGAANQANIGITALREMIFPLPPLHEQEQIVSKFEELMAFCDGLEQSIKESQGYNEMLLQQVLREALQGEKV